MEEGVLVANEEQLLSRATWKEGSVEGHADYSYIGTQLSRIDWFGNISEVLEMPIEYTTFEYDLQGKLTSIKDYVSGQLHREFSIYYNPDNTRNKVEYYYHTFGIHWHLRQANGTIQRNYATDGTVIGMFTNKLSNQNSLSEVRDIVANKSILIERNVNNIDESKNIYFKRNHPIITYWDGGYAAYGSFKYPLEDSIDVSNGANYIFIKMRSLERDIVPVSVSFYDGVRDANSDVLVNNVSKEWGIHTYWSTDFIDAYNEDPGPVDQENITHLNIMLDPAGKYHDVVEIEWILIGTSESDISENVIEKQGSSNEVKIERNHLGNRALVNFSNAPNWIDYSTFLPEYFGNEFHGASLSFKGNVVYEYKIK